MSQTTHFDSYKTSVLAAVLSSVFIALAASGLAQSANVAMGSPADAKIKVSSSLRSSSTEIVAGITVAAEDKNGALAREPLSMSLHPGGLPAMINTVAEGNFELLINSGGDASHVETALRSAVDDNNTRMGTALLEASAYPNLMDAKGVSPLRAAMAARQLELARLMIQHAGHPIDLLDSSLDSGNLPLPCALSECGLSPNQQDASEESHLVRAVSEKRPDLIKFLLEKGADASRPGLLGQPPLHMAAITRNMDALSALLDGGADPNQVFNSPVKQEFLQLVDKNSFKRWLERDAGLTLLMLSASRGDMEMLKALMKKGAKRDQRSKNWKRDAVVFACDNDHIPAAEILLGKIIKPGGEVHRVVISLSKQKAILYKGDKAVRTTRVSTGRKGFATPRGRYVITDKAKDWVSTIHHVTMPYYMRLNCRDFGIHAGACPGYPASRGCIRMPQADVKAMFALLKVGDQVTIED